MPSSYSISLKDTNDKLDLKANISEVFGLNQNSKSKLGLRQPGVNYTNVTDKIIKVTVVLFLSSSATNYVYVDESIEAVFDTQATGYYQSATFFVNPGSSYRITNTYISSIYLWKEMVE